MIPYALLAILLSAYSSSSCKNRNSDYSNLPSSTFQSTTGKQESKPEKVGEAKAAKRITEVDKDCEYLEKHMEKPFADNSALQKTSLSLDANLNRYKQEKNALNLTEIEYDFDQFEKDIAADSDMEVEDLRQLALFYNSRPRLLYAQFMQKINYCERRGYQLKRFFADDLDRLIKFDLEEKNKSDSNYSEESNHNKSQSSSSNKYARTLEREALLMSIIFSASISGVLAIIFGRSFYLEIKEEKMIGEAIKFYNDVYEVFSRSDGEESIRKANELFEDLDKRLPNQSLRDKFRETTLYNNFLAHKKATEDAKFTKGQLDSRKELDRIVLDAWKNESYKEEYRKTINSLNEEYLNKVKSRDSLLVEIDAGVDKQKIKSSPVTYNLAKKLSLAALVVSFASMGVAITRYERQFGLYNPKLDKEKKVKKMIIFYFLKRSYGV